MIFYGICFVLAGSTVPLPSLLMLDTITLASRLQVVVNGDSATILLDIDGPGCSLDDGEFQPCEYMRLWI